MGSDRPTGLRKHMAALVFWTAVLLSAVSLWLLPRMTPTAWLLVGASVLFNGWTLYQSDRGGFVRTRHAPRTTDPPRHFTPVQVAVVVLLVMAQIGLTLFLLIERVHLLG